MIKNTCFIGTGGCGNKLANELLNIDKSVHAIFVNSNINEMKKLSNFDINSENYLDIAGNGTGRNQDVAEESLRNDIKKIKAFFVNNDITRYHTYVIITSLDGGFGSGSIKPLASIIKNNLCAKAGINVDINVVGVLPKIENRIINLENALKSYNKIQELRQTGIVSSIQFIDNNKMINETVFNNNVMKEIYNMYKLNNEDLDVNDAKIINNTPGYKLPLFLRPNSEGDVNSAISDAVKKSPFVVPRNIGSCKSIGISVIEQQFDKQEILNAFNVFEFDKEDNNILRNIIVLSGIANPDEVIENYENKLLDLKTSLKNEPQDNAYKVSLDLFEDKKKTAPTTQKVKYTKEQMLAMLDDDDEDDLW